MFEVSHYIGNFTSETTLEEKAVQIFTGLDISESSRKDYAARIGIFLEYVKENKFSKDTFLEFKRYLAQRNDMSISTKAKYLTVGRVFLKELHRQGIIPVDITLNIKSFQQSTRHKRYGVNEDEVNLVKAQLSGLPDTPPNVRLKAVFTLLIYQGLRQIEIIRLDVEDLDLTRQTALILGKGRDDKEPVDLHPQSVLALKNYMDIARIRSGPLFTSMSNHNKHGRLTTKSLRELVKSTLTQLNINNTTHGFRHFFTTKLIASFSNDLLTVAKFTRHKSIETLQVYNDNLSRQENLPKYYAAFN